MDENSYIFIFPDCKRIKLNKGQIINFTNDTISLYNDNVSLKKKD